MYRKIYIYIYIYIYMYMYARASHRLKMNVRGYIYIYMCVCVCVCRCKWGLCLIQNLLCIMQTKTLQSEWSHVYVHTHTYIHTYIHTYRPRVESCCSHMSSISFFVIFHTAILIIIECSETTFNGFQYQFTTGKPLENL